MSGSAQAPEHVYAYAPSDICTFSSSVYGILLDDPCKMLVSALSLVGDIYIFLLVLFIVMALTVVIVPGAELP